MTRQLYEQDEWQKLVECPAAAQDLAGAGAADGDGAAAEVPVPVVEVGEEARGAD